MQIVIDIDDDMYKSVVNNDAYVLGDVDWILLENAIANSTPLPEHHGRLIDADEIQFENTEFDTYGDYCIAFDAIDQADTIIGAEGSESE